MGMEIRAKLRAERAFEDKRLGELTVAEFRKLMAEVFAAERKATRERKEAHQLSQWPYQIVKGMGSPE